MRLVSAVMVSTSCVAARFTMVMRDSSQGIPASSARSIQTSQCASHGIPACRSFSLQAQPESTPDTVCPMEPVESMARTNSVMGVGGVLGVLGVSGVVVEVVVSSASSSSDKLPTRVLCTILPYIQLPKMMPPRSAWAVMSTVPTARLGTSVIVSVSVASFAPTLRDIGQDITLGYGHERGFHCFRRQIFIERPQVAGRGQGGRVGPGLENVTLVDEVGMVGGKGKAGNAHEGHYGCGQRGGGGTAAADKGDNPPRPSATPPRRG